MSGVQGGGLIADISSTAVVKDFDEFRLARLVAKRPLPAYLLLLGVSVLLSVLVGPFGGHIDVDSELKGFEDRNHYANRREAARRGAKQHGHARDKDPGVDGDAVEAARAAPTSVPRVADGDDAARTAHELSSDGHFRVPHSFPQWYVTLIYMKEDDGNVLEPEAIAGIHAFEKRVWGSGAYQTHGWRDAHTAHATANNDAGGLDEQIARLAALPPAPLSSVLQYIYPTVLSHEAALEEARSRRCCGTLPAVQMCPWKWQKDDGSDNVLPSPPDCPSPGARECCPACETGVYKCGVLALPEGSGAAAGGAGGRDVGSSGPTKMKGIVFDGLGDAVWGTLDDALRHIVRGENAEGTGWFFGKDFNPFDLTSTKLRTELVIGAPLPGFPSHRSGGQTPAATAILHELEATFATFDVPGVRLVYGGDLLTDSAIDDILRRDSYFALSSIAIVLMYMTFHLRSLFIASLGMLQLLLTFPVSLFIYAVVCRESYIGPLNILSFYIMIGIGVDDIFVFSNAFLHCEKPSTQSLRQGSLRVGFGTALLRNITLEQRLSYALRKAGIPMLVTSTTSGVAFMANMVSSLEAVRSFGFLMGILIATNYAFVMTIYPCSLAVWATHVLPMFDAGGCLARCGGGGERAAIRGGPGSAESPHGAGHTGSPPPTRGGSFCNIMTAAVCESPSADRTDPRRVSISRSTEGEGALEMSRASSSAAIEATSSLQFDDRSRPKSAASTIEPPSCSVDDGRKRRADRDDNTDNTTAPASPVPTTGGLGVDERGLSTSQIGLELAMSDAGGDEDDALSPPPVVSPSDTRGDTSGASGGGGDCASIASVPVPVPNPSAPAMVNPISLLAAPAGPRLSHQLHELWDWGVAGCPVYPVPSTHADTVHTYPDEALIRCTKRDGRFYETDRGWVQAEGGAGRVVQYLTREDRTTTKNLRVLQNWGSVGCPVHEAADAGAAVVHTLHDGAIVCCLKEEAGFYLVAKGWIRVDGGGRGEAVPYWDVVESEPRAALGVYRVTAAAAAVRGSPDAGGDVVLTLTHGALVQGIAHSDDGGFIQVPQGWLALADLQPVTPRATTVADSPRDGDAFSSHGDCQRHVVVGWGDFGCPVYADPDAQARVLDVLFDGHYIRGTERNGRFLRVDGPEGGWVEVSGGLGRVEADSGLAASFGPDAVAGRGHTPPPHGASSPRASEKGTATARGEDDDLDPDDTLFFMFDGQRVPWVRRMFETTWFPLIHKGRYILLLIVVLITAAACYSATRLHHRNGPPAFFDEGHDLYVYRHSSDLFSQGGKCVRGYTACSAMYKEKEVSASLLGCDGVPYSGAELDACGVCKGSGSTCVGCDGVLGSNKKFSSCGVCGGSELECDRNGGTQPSPPSGGGGGTPPLLAPQVQVAVSLRLTCGAPDAAAAARVRRELEASLIYDMRQLLGSLIDDNDAIAIEYIDGFCDGGTSAGQHGVRVLQVSNGSRTELRVVFVIEGPGAVEAGEIAEALEERQRDGATSNSNSGTDTPFASSAQYLADQDYAVYAGFVVDVVAPVTLVPPTPAPPTLVPSTSAPPTAAPRTPVPNTRAPLVPTGVPATSSPPTSAPRTSAPPTGVPRTTAPTSTTPVPRADPGPDRNATGTSPNATGTPPSANATTTNNGTIDVNETLTTRTAVDETNVKGNDSNVSNATVSVTSTLANTTVPAEGGAGGASSTNTTATAGGGGSGETGPATEVPATASPRTEVPVITGAPVEVVDTGVPATAAPSTNAPDTDVPATGVPTTDAPATDAPAMMTPDPVPPPAVNNSDANTTNTSRGSLPDSGTATTTDGGGGTNGTTPTIADTPTPIGAPGENATNTSTTVGGAPTNASVNATATGDADAVETPAPEEGSGSANITVTATAGTDANASNTNTTAHNTTDAAAGNATVTVTATPAPVVDVPATPAPTPAPAGTPSPVSNVTNTSANATGDRSEGANTTVTPPPTTMVPETASPPTTAPTSPPTPTPETAAPSTDIPATTSPATAAPETEAPRTGTPATAAPETGAPDTAAPETVGPATELPETSAPVVETDAPEAGARTRAPATGAPADARTRAPATGTPAVGGNTTQTAGGAAGTNGTDTNAATGGGATPQPAAATDVPAVVVVGTDAPPTTPAGTPVPEAGRPATDAPAGVLAERGVRVRLSPQCGTYLVLDETHRAMVREELQYIVSESLGVPMAAVRIERVACGSLLVDAVVAADPAVLAAGVVAARLRGADFATSDIVQLLNVEGIDVLDVDVDDGGDGGAGGGGGGDNATTPAPTDVGAPPAGSPRCLPRAFFDTAVCRGGGCAGDLYYPCAETQTCDEATGTCGCNGYLRGPDCGACADDCTNAGGACVAPSGACRMCNGAPTLGEITNWVDSCGTCGPPWPVGPAVASPVPNAACTGCDGRLNSNLTYDSCGVCDGDDACRVVLTMDTNTVQVSIMWGLDEARSYKDELGENHVAYEPDYNPYSQECQVHFLEACRVVRELAADHIQEENYKCMFEEWDAWMRRTGCGRNDPICLRGLPLPGHYVDFAFQEWLFLSGDLLRFSPQTMWNGDPATAAMKAWELRFFTRLPNTASPYAIVGEFDFWEDTVMPALRANASDACRPMQTSPDYASAFVQVAAINGLLYAIAISALTCFAVVLAFTCNVALTLMILATMGAIILCTFMVFYALGWEVGAVEAVALSAVIGLSIDYSLHFAESYADVAAFARRHAIAFSRYQITRKVLTDMGLPLVNAAATTVLATVPLLLCTIKPLQQFGLVMVISISLSILYSMLLFVPLLLLCGPRSYKKTRWVRLAAVGVPAVLLGVTVLIIKLAGVKVLGPDGEPLL